MNKRAEENALKDGSPIKAPSDSSAIDMGAAIKIP
jgi:hypothetical protein